jgi:hypothetical protein
MDLASYNYSKEINYGFKIIMIDKKEFYHGVVLARLVCDDKYISLKKHSFGYVVNDRAFFMVKYTGKTNPPWRFTINTDDIIRLKLCSDEYDDVVLVLVCGGDGICPLSYNEFLSLVGEKDEIAWIAVKRGFNKQYNVTGSLSKLKDKVSMLKWPSIIFSKIKEGCIQ